MDKHFQEIEPGTDYGQLLPGLYCTGCSDLFGGENDHTDPALSAACLNCCFIGMLMPYFMHNINNLMVGVMGNLDLADMFMPRIDKVEPKLAAARAATGSVVEFIRDISDTGCSAGSDVFVDRDLQTALLTLRAACGRSVSTVGIDSMTLKTDIPCQDPRKIKAILNGMVAWTVLCLGGSGSVEGAVSSSGIGLRWSRPAGAGKPHMPGGEHAAAILVLLGGLSRTSGVALVVEEWTESAGGVSLVLNK